MITRHAFGRTGHDSSRIIFGSYALSEATQQEADDALDLLLKYGVNHIDTALGYGEAEKWVGLWMDRHRDDFFIATKTRSRSFKGAWRDLQISLKQLNVEQIDLWQMHGMTNPVGWQKAMGEGGVLEAFIKAREEGLVRFLGVTGHGDKVPAMHLQSLERFDFDSVLLPYNYPQMQNRRYAAGFNDLVELCRTRKTAVQTIKSVVRRPWGTRTKTHNTYFYEPLTEQDAVDKAVHWAMGLKGGFIITAGDMQVLPLVLDAASRFKIPPSDTEMKNLVAEYHMSTIRGSVRDFR